MNKCLPLLACVFTLPVLAAPAADYLGAAAVLKKSAEAARPAPGVDPNTVQSLQADLVAFGKEATSLDPAEAARTWLALTDRSLTVVAGGNDYRRHVDFAEFVKALPPPAAWPALRASVTPPPDASGKQREARLLTTWFVDRLLGDAKFLPADFAAIAGLKLGRMNDDPSRAESDLDSLAGSTLAIMTDPREKAALLRSRLDAMIAACQQARQLGYNDSETFRVPDLALMVDDQTARELLARVLTAYPGVLGFEMETATGQIAAQIALEKMDSLAAPQWSLACSLEGGPIYDGMLQRFGPSLSQADYQRARTFAFYRAILERRPEDAFKLAQQIGGAFDPDEHSLSPLVDMGRGGELCSVFHRLLEAGGNPRLWNTYIPIATRADQTGPMLQLLDDALAKPGLDPELQKTLDDFRIDALLATNQPDKAAALLSKRFATLLAANGNGLANASSLSLRLARLGAALDRRDWFDEGLAGAQQALQKLLANPEQLSSAVTAAEGISGLLLDAGRGPEAEAVWVEALTACRAALSGSDGRYSFLDSTTPEVLRGLVEVYAAAGRSADILVLIDQAPGWGAGDLAAIFETSCSTGKHRSEPLGVIVARALMDSGRRDEAAGMIELMLPSLMADDSAYALLLELRGQAAMPVLDRLAALDAFEERPLIWKAQLLLEAEKLDEAERVARQAISIDPSDGGEGPGDRMRVYSVLAEILAARGDAKNAEFFKNVVKSIRRSETADTFYNLGLLQRAIALYQESLTSFADAYCIQSRLALRMVEAGDWKGAEEHYRKAYELMPESFGRVESHCFGCERAFAGKPQQSIAERVFTRLAREQPDKPQVHYLLGYLYEEQGRVADAIPEFRKAVELDPDYLNAWKKLSDAPAAALAPAEHQRIQSNLIRLDPAGRHRSLNLDGAGDLSAIWIQLTAAEKIVPKPVEKIYPLPASAAQQAAAAADPRLRYYLEHRDEQRRLSPGAIFSEQRFAQNVESWMSMVQSSARGE